MLKNISLLIKPSSSNCNLACKYCFYYDVAANRDYESFGFMQASTMKSLIIKALDSATDHITFAFQGGEPTLIGLDYFKDFVATVNQHISTQTIHYAIQTNGTLLTDEFCAFLHQNNFLVGLSLDGPKDMHDLNRIDAKKSGSFKSVDQAARLMAKHKVDFNILTVVTKNTVRHVQKIYRYFKSQGYQYLQFIPCISDFNDSKLQAFNITPEEYGNFLVQLFDLWYQDIIKGEHISIRLFDNYVQMLLGMPPESCDMNGFCSVNPVIEADGSVYPCDFYVLDQWKLGNIKADSLESMISGALAHNFVSSGSKRAEECDSCTYYQLCRSGCRRHKEMFADTHAKSDQDLHDNYFCESYKIFFHHSSDKLKQIARFVRSRQGI
jgi:uncharacterized protein